MKRFCKEKRGFTIIEVLVSIIILAMTTLATVETIIFLFKYTVMNNNQVIATNLAREGIELIRNQRDSNWLQWSGSLRESWNNGFDGVTNSDGVLYTDYSPQIVSEPIPSGVVNGEPQKLYFIAQREPYIVELLKVNAYSSEADYEAILNDDATVTDQQLNYLPDNGYVHTDGNATAFYRFIEVSYFEIEDGVETPAGPDNIGSTDSNTAKVVSVVGYKHNNRWRTVQVETYLTDWYQRTDHDDNP